MSYTPFISSSVGTGTTGPSVVILKASASATLTKNRVVTLSSGDADYTITLSGNTALNQDVSTTGSPTFANALIGTGSRQGIFNVATGRAFFGANSENYSIGVGYTQARVNSGQTYYMGATDSATPSFILSNAAGTTRLTLTDAGVLTLTSPLPFGSGGTGLTALGSGLQIPRTNAGATAWEWYTPASTLGGTVTSVSFTGGLISVATPTIAASLTVAGTSGGVVYFDSASTWASSAALTANSPVLGGGAGAAPSTVAGITTDGTSMLTLGVNTTTLGKVKMFGNTSGDATIQPAAVAGTSTVITLPNVTCTLLPNTTTSGVGTSPTSSSTTTITHGLGRIPTIIRIYGGGSFTANNSAVPTTFAIGLYCSTGNACMYQPYDPTTITASEPMATSTAYAVRCDTGVGNFVTGVIQNVTSTQFDIVWTETGTSAAQVYIWEAQ